MSVAVLLTTRWPGVSVDGYETLRRAITAEGPFPSSLVVQVVAASSDGLVLTEVWDSVHDAETFRRGRLGEAASRVGIAPPPAPAVLDVHRILGPGGRPSARNARRVLLVANQTLGTVALEAEMHKRSAQGSYVFHLLVPAVPVPDAATRPGTVEATGDLFLEDQRMQHSWEQARQILDEHLDALRRRGLDVTGEVGSADPFLAVRSVLSRRRFDEVILSTLPSGISRWLGMDLPRRLRRSLDIPLTVVTAGGEGPPGDPSA